ncbi:phosphohydrolase [Proteiniphilum sp. UBA1028]|jgi:(p)ppGpp synthase/HD superfamily hydrolase|uniref:phosphohydrolase n=1 Tax=Proteiniphilum sp. UBA1028 TaxID=1947251 RepID=UPI0025E44485|nr:phosphohydrolase [Proteiniphilum sp. UBA1028]
MNLKEQLNKAIEIAISAHEGQLDTHNGRPYIEHPFRVMNAGHTLQEKIVGILHDVVEDTSWTLQQLAEEGFSKETVDSVDALSRRDNESYDEYILRLQDNPTAVRVKLNDLTDNMDIRRWNEVQYQDLARLQKYLEAYKLLTEQEHMSSSREKFNEVPVTKQNREPKPGK